MIRTVRMLVVLSLASGTAAAGTCPAAVPAAVKKAFPDGTALTCAPHGKDFEVRLTRNKAELQVDVSATGEILLVEEPIPVSSIPATVMKAFSAKYPKAKATKAEKMTKGPAVSFELAFSIDGRRREATFNLDGTFVEEE